MQRVRKYFCRARRRFPSFRRLRPFCFHGVCMKIIGLIAFFSLAIGCSTSASSGDPPQALTTDKDAAVGGDPACTTTSVDTGRSDLPDGGCTIEGASCEFHLVRQCGPGVAFVATSPEEYRCSCDDKAWNCVLIGGGFGLTPCPEGGVSSDGGGSDSGE